MITEVQSAYEIIKEGGIILYLQIPFEGGCDHKCWGGGQDLQTETRAETQSMIVLMNGEKWCTMF
jgi:hypothetical protein